MKFKSFRASCHHRIPLLILLILSIAIQSLPSFAHSRLTPVPADLWGMHINRLNLVGAGDGPYPPRFMTFKTIRLHDGLVSWANIQPAPGVFDWSILDAWVRLGEQKHVDLIYDFYNTPTWASSDPTLQGAEGLGGSAPPANMNDYVTFVKAVVHRYQGRIKYYEGWNEANDGWNANEDPNFVPQPLFFFTGTPHQLLALQKANFQIVKSIDPHAQVLSPAFTIDTDAVKLFFSIGAAKWFDIFAFHYYVDGPPELISQEAVANKQTLVAFGHGQMPHWNSETGWLPPFAQSPNPLAPGYVARAYLIAWFYGIDRFCWYAYDTDPAFVPLVLNGPVDLSVITPAGFAYRRIQDWLIGKVVLSITPSANHTLVATLLDHHGLRSTIVWTSDDLNRTYQIPGRFNNLNATDINGNAVPISNTGIVQVGPGPVLLSR